MDFQYELCVVDNIVSQFSKGQSKPLDYTKAQHGIYILMLHTKDFAEILI